MPRLIRRGRGGGADAISRTTCVLLLLPVDPFSRVLLRLHLRRYPLLPQQPTRAYPLLPQQAYWCTFFTGFSLPLSTCPSFEILF